MRRRTSVAASRAVLRKRRAGGTVALALCITHPLLADQRPAAAPVSVAVKQLGTVETPATANTVMAADVSAQPTMPDARLPQYQFGHEQRVLATAEQLRDPRLRFLLALPSQPLLVAAEITIDGKPFRMAREQRVQEILATLTADRSEDRAAPTVEETAAVEQSATEATEAEAPDQATQVPYAPASSVADHADRYFAATQGTPDAEEIRWLLTNWIDGPDLLLLQDHFQRSRASQRPAFDVLDRDRDGVLSAEELQRGVESIEECDLNRDGVVTFLEMAECAKDPRRKASATPSAGRLVTLLPPAGAEAARVLSHRIRERYAVANPESTPLNRFDADQSGALEAGELEALRGRSPDIALSIAFNSNSPGESSLTLTEFNPDVVDELIVSEDSPALLTILSEGCEVQIAAVQRAASDQVSLGAVDDGYPMLPELDPSGDDRLTVRERRGLLERILAFDRDGDGSIRPEETRAPIRLCIGLGPIVHQDLEGLREVGKGKTPAATQAPDWFVRMDRNRDGDLARNEFPGTDDQFTRLDADGDQLVSGEEAVQFDNAAFGPMGGR